MVNWHIVSVAEVLIDDLFQQCSHTPPSWHRTQSQTEARTDYYNQSSVDVINPPWSRKINGNLKTDTWPYQEHESPPNSGYNLHFSILVVTVSFELKEKFTSVKQATHGRVSIFLQNVMRKRIYSCDAWKLHFTSFSFNELLDYFLL